VTPVTLEGGGSVGSVELGLGSLVGLGDGVSEGVGVGDADWVGVALEGVGEGAGGVPTQAVIAVSTRTAASSGVAARVILRR